MVDRCMRTDSSHCDPSRITLDLRSRVIQLGSQLQESFLTHLSTIRFSLSIILLVHHPILRLYYTVVHPPIVRLLHC